MLPAIVLFAALGCGKGYDQAQMSKLSSAEYGIVGRYTLEVDYGTVSKDLKELLDVMTAMSGGRATLECMPDHSFVMTVNGVPVRGTWRVDSNNVRLRLQQVGDLKPSQVRRVELSMFGFSSRGMTRKDAEKLMREYMNSVALERAESMALMRIGTDGRLYAVSRPNETMFSAASSYFVKEKG